MLYNVILSSLVFQPIAAKHSSFAVLCSLVFQPIAAKHSSFAVRQPRMLHHIYIHNWPLQPFRQDYCTTYGLLNSMPIFPI